MNRTGVGIRSTNRTRSPQERAKPIQYRPDIDGLRAVAVMAVVLFHARLGAFPGGFVGVDVFFVISGYLITSIILERGSLSRAFFTWFYERRIRRLFPPVIPVLLFSGIAAYKLLPPPELQEYGQSIIAFLTFWSNWFFWSISGYFDGPAQSKPLLHTWSLSVEEQFYILFPPIILVASRFGRAAVTNTLATIMAVSLCISAATVWAGHTDLAFFNSFGRFWEIALGSLLAAASVPRPTSEVTRSVVGSGGLLAILLCVFMYNETTRFPAVIPAIGAALIIYANGGWAGRILSTPPMVGLGLVSYAIYLWHWPIFVFLGFYWLLHPTPVDYGFGIAATLAAAVLSYFLIERPVREKRFMASSRSVFAFFGLAGAALASVGIVAAATGGLPGRVPGMLAYQGTKEAMRTEFVTASLRDGCWVGGEQDMTTTIRACMQPVPGLVNVLLVGDSHAAQFFTALSHHAPDVNVDLVAVDSCVFPTGTYAGCNQLGSWLLTNLAGAGYDYLVISSRGLDVKGPDGMLAFAGQVAKHIPVTILGPIQYYDPSMPTIYSLAVDGDTHEQIGALFDESVVLDQFEVDRLLREARLPDGVRYVSLLAVLCPNGPGSCSHFDKNGLPILLDGSHLSLPASEKLISDIGRLLPF
jgi:peptidoglycan/LPS O-acetylase OafA/YrhL